jgi:hypothetical protein
VSAGPGELADRLNEANAKTRYGREWCCKSVRALLDRLQIEDTNQKAPAEVAGAIRARVGDGDYDQVDDATRVPAGHAVEVCLTAAA